MADIGGDGLYWKSTLDNDEMIAAMDETLRRIKGLSDGTVAYGETADLAFAEASAAVGGLKQRLKELKDKQAETLAHIENASKAGLSTGALRAEYDLLTKDIGRAESRISEYEKVIKNTANSHKSLKQELKEVEAEMRQMSRAGQENTQAYQDLKRHAGDLRDTMDDVSRQIRTMANDEGMFQGVITGLSGLSGGFSAATGAMSLFTGENENLQRIMTKLQSVMAIAIGMQQVAQTLNKDSAFRLVTINGLKEWWNRILAKSVVVEKAETEAIVENTGAKVGNTVATGGGAVAAGAGTKANIGLAASFRAVGLAIKSIPVFGWIIAGVTALVAVYMRLTSAAREAAKEQKEFFNKVAENAARPVGTIMRLRTEWNRLGEDIKSKERFIRDNAAAFNELGVAIEGVADAENLLSNPANVQKFINAQIAKAKSMAVLEGDAYKAELQKSMDAKLLFDKEVEKFDKRHPDQVAYLFDKDHYYFANESIEKQWKKIQESNKKLEEYHNQSLNYLDEYNKKLEEGGFTSKKQIEDTLEYYENAISELREKQKKVNNEKAYADLENEIDAYQKKIDKIKGTVNKPPSDDKKAAEEVKRALEEIGKLQVEMRRKLDDAEIDAKEEGDKKKLAQIDRAYQDEVDRIEEWKEKLKAANKVAGVAGVGADGLTSLQRDQYDMGLMVADSRRVADATKLVLEWQRLEEESYREMLRAYGDYEEKKLALTMDYEGKIAEARADGRENEVALLERKMQGASAQLAGDELVKSGWMERMFGAVDKMSRKSILTAKKEIEGLIKYLQTGGSAGFVSADQKSFIDAITGDPERAMAEVERLNGLLSQTDEGLKRLDSRNPFKQIKRGFENLRASAEGSAEQFEALDGILSGIGTFGSMFTDLGRALEGAGLKAGKVVVAVGDVIGGIASMAAAGSAFGPWGTAIGAVVGAVTSLIPALSSAGAMSEETRNYYESLIAITDKLIERQMALVESSSATGARMAAERSKAWLEYQRMVKDDYIAAYMDSKPSGHSESWQLNKRLMDIYAEKYVNMFLPFDPTQTRQMSEFLRHLEGQNFQFGSSLGFDSDALKAAGIDMIALIENAKEYIKSLDREQIIALQEHAPELWAALGEEVQDYLNWVVEVEDQLREIERITRESVTGITFDELSSGIDALVRKFDLAFEDIAESFEDYMSKAIMNTLKKQWINAELEEWHKQLEAALADESISEAEAEALKARYEEIVRKGNESYRSAMEAMGIDLDKTEKAVDKSLTGAVKGITEEQAGMLGGQMNAVRMGQSEQTVILRDQLLYLANIDRNTLRIDENTRYIKGIYERMDSGVDSLRANGYS